MYVVTAEEMRAIEQRAEREYGLSSAALMERAGASCAEALRDALGGAVAGREILLLIGPGNNGGDGRVMGRVLRRWGARVSSYLWRGATLESTEGTVPVGDDLAALQPVIAAADVVVDALLGTGASRPLDGAMRAALALVRAERARRPTLTVCAVDLPSGVNAESGAADPGALAADLTVTLALPKLGLLLFPGAAHVGTLRVGSIGLPAEMALTSGVELLDDALLRPLVPARPLEGHKGTFGKVVLLVGSAQYLGAAALATEAAGRVGAGLLALATTAERAPFYAMRLPETTFVLLPPEDADPEARAQRLLAALPGSQALVVGPGLGQTPATRALLSHVFDGVRALSPTERPRLIVDADGLNALAQRDEWWHLLPERTVLTPHPGEMSRLLGGVAVSAGGADRLRSASEAAQRWGHIVVLKGAVTVLAAPEGALRLNWPGNPALATGGTGDVLSGIVGGLLAQGMEPYAAACLAVAVHSRAGLRVSARLGSAGLLASDLLPEVPVALAALRDGGAPGL